MGRLLLALIIVNMSSGALAQSRPSTLRMSCLQARSLVLSQGAVVLSTGPTTYDRYVSGGNFCQWGERSEPTWVPAADTPQCHIGFVCAARPQRSSR